MPPEGAGAAYLWDIIDAGQAITAFIAGKTFADYEADRMLRRALFSQPSRTATQRFRGVGLLPST
jgi:hypothetical protein